MKTGIYEHGEGKFYDVLGVGKFTKCVDSSWGLPKIGYDSDTLEEIEIFWKNEGEGCVYLLGGNRDPNLEHVIYESLYDHKEYGKYAVFVREKEEFLGDKIVGRTIIPRFTHTEPES